MEKSKVYQMIRGLFIQDGRIVFAYPYGSFVTEEYFRDIDIGIYVKSTEENTFVITSHVKTELSRLAKSGGLNFTADQFDVKVINDAPFTFLKRIFTEGILLIDNDPDLRTDIVELVSLKYRECAGLLAEASLG